MTRSRRYRIYAATVVLAIAAEMVWIGGAAALGTKSHFNENSVGAAIYAVMGLLAIWLTGASAVYARSIGRAPTPMLSPALRSGIVTGLALTLPLTLISAGYMSNFGSHAVGTAAAGAVSVPVMDWSREIGDLRVAHFFATHSMHAIPLAALAIGTFRPRGVAAVHAFAAVYVLFVLAVFVQATRGLPFI